jgi:hypothetical protein
MRYLYGASVQGIQDFITQTGRLKEIVGASEIVEMICTELFYDWANISSDSPNLIRSAAGNIRYVFDKKDDCETIVKNFPKAVMEAAPGIRLSQAVVEFEPGGAAQALRRIETELQVQRNRIPKPIEIGFMGLERSRRSGNVAVKFVDNEAICTSIDAKLEASGKVRLLSSLTGQQHPDRSQFEIQIDKMVLRDGNRWVAVVHADGNGMGAIIQKLSEYLENEKNDERVKNVFREFSLAIDKCTKKAVQRAFQHVEEKYKLGPRNGARKATYPIRPLVIGGDDLTIVMRADLAFDFTHEYLRAFEEETEVGFSKLFSDHQLELDISPRLTVCAGIAYVGDSYPFHYAVDMAEALCKEAKKASKKNEDNPAPSSLSFYKVQDSFIEPNIEDIRTRTQHTPHGIRFDHGPYFLDTEKGVASIQDMQHRLETLNKVEKDEASASLSKLRKWVTETYRNAESAGFLMDRIKQIEDERTGIGMYESLDLQNHRNGRSIVMELLQLHGFNQ